MPRRGMADVSRMLVGVIDHLKGEGREGRRQLAYDSCLHAHSRASIHGPPGGHAFSEVSPGVAVLLAEQGLHS